MKEDTAIQFETRSRIHMGLAAKDIERSIAFYRTLFGVAPSKQRPGYARFECADPPVILSLNQSAEQTRPGNGIVHSGIQVKSTAAVHEAALRLGNAGYETVAEEEVACCYAVQNKVWTADPDGNRWEIYVVIDDDGHARHPSRRDRDQATPSGALCCTPGTDGCKTR